MRHMILLTGVALSVLGLSTQAQEPTPPRITVKQLTQAPTSTTATRIEDRLITIPDLPPGDPHHAVMAAVRASMAQACMTCHGSPHNSKQVELLGLAVAPADATLREQLGLAQGGLVVTAVESKSPAASTGIVVNDILVTAQNKSLTSADDFKTSIKEASGKELEIAWLHEGAKKSGKISPSFAKGEFHSYGFPAGHEPSNAATYWIGVSINPASEAVRSHLKLDAGIGLVVNEVVKDSPAAKAGIKINDVLVNVGDKPLKAPGDLITAVQATKDQQALLLAYYRALNRKEIEVKPEKRKVESTVRVEVKDMKANDPYRPMNPNEIQAPVVYRLLVPKIGDAMSAIDPAKVPSYVTPIEPKLQALWAETFNLPQSSVKLDQIERQLKDLTDQIKVLKESIERRPDSEKTNPKSGGR